jgi:hypothetical protein
LSAESDLLGLGEEVVDASVQHQPSHPANRHLFFRDDLRSIQDVEREILRELLIEELQAKFPLRKVAGLDRLPQVAPVKVRVGSIDLDRFVPYHRLHPQLGLPMEFNKCRFAFSVYQAKGMDTTPFHETKGATDSTIRHDPHRHVDTFRRQRNKIPEIIVRGLSLWKTAVGFLLGGMDKVGKLDRILDEEHGNVVSDDVPVALLCVELDGKATHVAYEIGRAFIACHSRKPDEGRLVSPALWNRSALVMVARGS